MTPKHSPTPDEEVEMRVTALLLGELSSEEAAAVQARIAAEPGLAALHTRLSKALELLREATAQSDEPAAAAPVQLSPERRERLLAHFKTAPSQAVSKPIPITSARPKRDWSWLPPLGIAAAVVALFGGLAMPKFANVPIASRERAMTVTLDEGQVMEAPHQYGFEKRKTEYPTIKGHPEFTPPVIPPNAVTAFGPLGALPTVPPPPPSAAVPAFSSQSTSADASRIASNSTTIVLPNLNSDATQSPSFWDTNPAGGGGGLALCQLLQFEFQRYPDHPATTSLAPVLTDLLKNSYGSTSSGGESNQSSANFTSTQLYGLVPRYSTTDMTTQPGSTSGGTLRQIVDNSAAGEPSLTAGSGEITKSGGGNWAFSGSNSYSGATTITAGNIATSGAGGTLDVNSSIGGTLNALPGSNLNGQNQAIGSLGDGNTYVSGTKINGGTALGSINGSTALVINGTSGPTDAGATIKAGTGTLSLGSASSNALTPNLYFGGSSVLRPMPETSDVATSTTATSVRGEDGKDVNGRNITETAKQISTMHIAKARDAALKGDNQTLETELTAATEIWPRNPALAEVSKQIFSQGDVQQKAVVDFEELLSQKNYRQIYEERARFIGALGFYPDKAAKLKEVLKNVQPIEVAIQNPTTTPGLNFGNSSQTLNLDSGGLLPSGAQAGFGAGKQSFQDDSITLSSRQGSGTLTINGGASNTFGGTISGQLNLTGGNTFTGTALTSIAQDPNKGGFANEEEWRMKALPAKPSAHAAVDAASGKPAAIAQDWASNRIEGFFYENGTGFAVDGITPPTINAAGEPVRSKEEKEEVVETVVPPQVAPIELPLMPKDGPTPSAYTHTFTRRELDPTDSPDQNRDEAKLASDAKAADRLKPAAPAVTQETENPAQTAAKAKHPYRTFFVDDGGLAAAAPATPQATPAPSTSAPAIAGADASSLTASNHSSNAVISPGAINSLQFPGVNGNVATGKPAEAAAPIPVLPAGLPATPIPEVESAKTPQAALTAGKAAIKDRDYEKATAYFKRASDLSAGTGKAHSLHQEAVDQFSTTSVNLANELITEGRYQQAQDTLTSVLGEHYDPHNKKAVVLLSHLEQPDYFNKSVDPKFRQNGEQVKQWFVEAQGLYDTGRLDLAKQRCEKILELDPYNRAAREFEGKIEHARDDYGIAAYNQTRAKQVADVDNAWAMPVRKFNIESTPASSDASTADTAEIRRKLERIIIPKLELHDATVREAIDFLKKQSVELDASSPAGSKGTNIVLKLPEAASGKGKAKDASNPADARITVSLTNIPMIEALKYVTGLANLKFKVEPHAVSVVPLTWSTEDYVTKTWKIPPGVIPMTSEKGANSKDAEAKAREAAKNWLIANGVQFNGTASATYNAKTGRLIVRDTQEQLDLVDQIVEAESAATAKPKPQTPVKAEPKPEAPAKPQAPPALIPQPEIQTQDNAFSTFSLNVSDVSFKLAAASLEQGHLPDPSTVRSEEFINAFDYRDPEPAPGAPLAFLAERAHDPFAQNRDLLRFSVKTAAAGRQPGRPLNIVLLLDKSGSMERADRVNIVREALRVLTAQLQPADTLSIVTFARTPHLWADGVAGDKAGDLIAKVSEITPEGGTNLEAALDLGYETAQRHFAVTSINRVVLFTDGAANLGDVNPEALTKKVEAKRKQGVALDCFGIGWEGYNDDLLEQLTRNGDGRYGFINTPEEAKENFAAQLAGALRVAASDVKVQVEFNPRRVTAYRQIGYAKHQLTKEQFRDNSVAAAQIGAAESGNALYVVAIDPKGEGDIATVRVRYRVPGTSDYREHEWIVSFQGNTPALEQASPALRLAGTAAAFSEMLAANPYAGDVTSDRLLPLLDGVPAIYGADPRPQKLEWMIRQARSLSGR